MLHERRIISLYFETNYMQKYQLLFNSQRFNFCMAILGTVTLCFVDSCSRQSRQRTACEKEVVFYAYLGRDDLTTSNIWRCKAMWSYCTYFLSSGQATDSLGTFHTRHCRTQKTFRVEERISEWVDCLWEATASVDFFPGGGNFEVTVKKNIVMKKRVARLLFWSHLVVPN